MQELQAGPNQLIVVYETDDTSSMIEPTSIWARVATDAERRAAEGWRILSTAVTPMRQMGTAGNILFQSGGQFATQVAVTVVYARA
jgi:hypothetical protein